MTHPNSSTQPVLHQEDGLSYLAGFGNTFESECLPGALPLGRNNPRQVPYGLYTECLSGTAFTETRATNRRTWLYRIQPSVVVNMSTATTTSIEPNPFRVPCQSVVDPLRWKPMVAPTGVVDLDFVSSWTTMCQAGDVGIKNGLSIAMFHCNQSMKDCFSNADGDLLIVPQQGRLRVHTELGVLIVEPCEIVVIPRGIVFQVLLLDSEARGYILEVYKGGFQLPELGPIGSNGLANARDFLHPTSWCVSKQEYRQPTTILCKMECQLYRKESTHSPFNVVAWHGNYLPYKYDLRKFCAVNSVTYDHLDPSIYTVLTCPSDHPGTALADFVVFPPRIMATDSNTFRPPWFHRNTMSEFMGMIYGQYDAKTGFMPGGASLHNCMTPHGPDAESYAKAVADECTSPTKFEGGMAFMFETSFPLKVSTLAMTDASWRDMEYADCWQELEDQFTGWDALNGGGQASK